MSRQTILSAMMTFNVENIKTQLRPLATQTKLSRNLRGPVNKTTKFLPSTRAKTVLFKFNFSAFLARNRTETEQANN